MSLFLPVDGPVYMIRRKDRDFFLFDVVPNTSMYAVGGVALWTPVQFKAREFYSEESVEQFKFERLQHRPCEIIMVK